MSKNLTIARECGMTGPWMSDFYKHTLVFSPSELDAFAERIRAEQKSGAPEPSGERAALIKRLRDSGKSVMETIKDALQAADMLAADAPEQEPVGWMRKWAADKERPEKVKNENGRWVWPGRFKFLAMTEFKCLKDDVPIYLAPPAPQARELSSKEIKDWWARDNGLEDCDMCKLDDFTTVVRAVESRLAARSEA